MDVKRREEKENIREGMGEKRIRKKKRMKRRE